MVIRLRQAFLILLFALSTLPVAPTGSIAQETAPSSDRPAATTDTAAKPAKIIKPAEKLPVTAFAALPFIEQAEISPNGLFIAGLLGVKGEQRIAMFPIFKDSGSPVVVGIPDETELASIRWVNDDHIIVTLQALARVEADRWYIQRLYGINRMTGKLTPLLSDMGGQNAADVLYVPSDGTNEILVAAQETVYTNQEGFWPTVFRVDVTNGKRRKVVVGKPNVWDWAADSSGNVRLGFAYNDDNQKSRLLYAKEGTKEFRSIESANLGKDERLTVPFLFIPGTDHALIEKDNANGQTSIVETNIVTKQDIRYVYEPAKGNVEWPLLSYDGKILLGVTTDDQEKPVHWLDPEMEKAQAYLNAAAKNAKARIISFNRDQSRMLVRISSPDNPGLLFLFDAKTQALEQISAVNSAIGVKRLAPAQLVQYKARDGLEIEGILTLPKGRIAKNLPFIIMPHGGPWAHDTLSYDYWTQFLANRGYAVLQPNFRGSTGYGNAFLKAGEGQMGYAMQDDVTDGVHWAVKEGIADPKRVCIVGASYGGYAAMWGIAKDPDLYRCAISIAGVANLRREVNDFGNSSRSNLFRDQWQRMTPDFNAVSPIKAVERIKAPLLLIHGKKDVTVDHVQSVIMEKAMRGAGKPVEFVSLPLADHHFGREDDRMTLLTSIEAFLAKHNPAD